MEQVLVVFGITFSVMISPGPHMLIVTRNTLISGRSAGLQTSLGILAGNSVHIVYCALGVGWLISRSIVAFSVLKYLGAAYLIHLGIASFRAGHQSLDVDASGTSSPDPRARRTWFIQGFMNNLLNPKGTLFYLGVCTVVITPETTLGMAALLVLCMTLLSSSFWVVFVYALDRPVVRGFLETSQQSVNRAFGVLLVGLGLRVAPLER